MRPAYGAEEIRIGQHLFTIVVDVANVMGSRPDGWWRDRAGAAVRLHAELVRLAASGVAASGLAASGWPVLPDEAVPPGTATPDAPPGFVMVLEGAAKAAAARIAPTVSPDGSVRAPEPGQVTVVQAPGSGDDAIVAVVRALTGHRVVVTADRELRDRCVAAGATILRPGWLLGLLRP
jgi:8-oxo-dGTP diphosphatase